VLVLLALAASPAFAWDTKTTQNPDGSESWVSVYYRRTPPADLLPDPQGFTGNEHAELAHLALQQLGIAGAFGIRTDVTGLDTLDVVDLNGALARRALMQETRVGDDTRAEAVLEERMLPPPAQFAGLPDFSFTLYDWINKSTLCPPRLAPGSLFPEKCHVYFGGYLTLYNSSHFGSQCTTMYRRYHTIALGLAERAKVLRTTLEARSAADATAHTAYAREAELEALSYEGFAQHFLQDRWSIGHMWERYNGPDQDHSADFVTGSLAGAVSGLIHGSEALTGLPDPMSSPPVFAGSSPIATPVLWFSVADGVSHPGLGDERLRDIYDGTFGAEYGYPNMPVAVPIQRAQMLECSEAGWAEIVHGFGLNTTGSYGAWSTTLPATSFPPVLSNSVCWDNWAMNGAIRTGWVDDEVATTATASASVLSRLALGFAGVVPLPAFVAAATLNELRSELTALTTRIRTRAAAAPAAQDLARGGMGAILGVQPGNAYAAVVPEYAEPENLEDLDDANPRGGDKLAAFGFFNRAHADFWCRNVGARLRGLRGTHDPVNDAACAYLADRVYKGTRPAYQGRRQEHLRLGSSDVDPICANFGVTGSAVDDELPYYLHPGYVGEPEARGPYAHRSIAAWCRKVPVIDGGPCAGDTPPDEDAAWDVVGRVERDGGTVPLSGKHFGTVAGEVWIAGSEDGQFLSTAPVMSWSDTAITLEIPKNYLPTGDWFLQVRPTTDESGWSVGRFILRVGNERCAAHEPTLLGLWRIGNPSLFISPLEVYFFEDGAVVQYDNQFFTTWHTVATWSTLGPSILIEPCPGIPLGKATFRFQGTWSAHPVTDALGIVSCPGPHADDCPAMRGAFTRFFDDGSQVPSPYEFNSTAGSVPLDLQFPLLPTQDCHGGCWERWTLQWPHLCAPIGASCGGAAAPTCSGQCPDGLECNELDGACACLTVPRIPCVPPNGNCPIAMTCRSTGVCVH
jgi:hypothetical protein